MFLVLTVIFLLILSKENWKNLSHGPTAPKRLCGRLNAARNGKGYFKILMH